MPRQDDRTEQATSKHREQARRQGQVARSTDVGGSLVLAAGLFALSLLGPHIVDACAASFRQIFAEIADPERALSAAGLAGLMSGALDTIALGVGPLAAICMVTGLFAGAAQVGFRPTPQALKLDFKRIDPLTGMRNLLGTNLLFEAGKAILKIAVVGAVAALALIPDMSGIAAQVGIPPAALGVLLGSKALGIAQRAAFAYLLIAAIDYAWRRRRHERQLRMTKREVKDELRQHGVSAEVKAVLRRRQAQAARARMMAAVPDADVVVTNPTHFAVALRYDGLHAAPEVIAKGQELIAAQIRRVAREHGVPIVSDPPLARALHDAAEVGQLIPRELYGAVARVLAYVYRLAGRGTGPRARSTR